MTQAILLTFLLGVVLSRSFKVFVLIPSSAFLVFIALFISASSSASIAGLSITTGMAIISLQMGYLCGILAWHLLASSDSPHLQLDFQNSLEKIDQSTKASRGPSSKPALHAVIPETNPRN